jgi:hypothetical protein
MRAPRTAANASDGSMRYDRRRSNAGSGESVGQCRAQQARQHELKEIEMARKAVIGPEIVKAVGAKTKTGMNRTQAFAAVAQERGSNPGTVAANFYRMQRKQDPKAIKSPRPRKRSPRPAPRTQGRTRTPQPRSERVAPSKGTVDINRLTSELISAVNALAGAVASQQREAQALRSRLEEMRSALG